MPRKQFKARTVREQFRLPNGISLLLSCHASTHRNRMGRTVGVTEGTAICHVYLVVSKWDSFLYPELIRIDHSDGPDEWVIVGEVLEALYPDTLRLHIDELSAVIRRMHADIQANPAE